MVKKQHRTREYEVVESKHITTRMSEGLWDAVVAAAAKAGLRKSEYVRVLLAIQVGHLKLRVPVSAKQLKGKGKAGL